MSTLSATTVLAHPGSGEPFVLLAGSEVPDWAVDMVGDHLIADAETDTDTDTEGDGDTEGDAEGNAEGEQDAPVSPRRNTRKG